MQKIIYTSLIVLMCTLMHAQVNIKIGYNAQYSPFTATNRLFDTYNTATKDLTAKYKKFHFMHGLDLGLRYMLTGTLGVEASFTNLYTSDNKSARSINGVIAKDEWRISHRFLSLGIENYFGWIGYGVHLGQSKWKYLKDFPGSSSKQLVHDTNLYGVKFNLIIQAKSNKNAFALKPYYYYPLSNRNIASVDEALNNTANLTVENFQGFGLSIVFYNGPQR